MKQFSDNDQESNKTNCNDKSEKKKTDATKIAKNSQKEKCAQKYQAAVAATIHHKMKK